MTGCVTIKSVGSGFSDKMTGLEAQKQSLINGGTFDRGGRKDRRDRVLKRKFGCSRMTVCIAMIVTDPKTQSLEIVFTADRLVSTDTVCFEGGFSKIQPFYPHTYVMTSSNDAPTADKIIIKTQKILEEKFESNEDLTVEQIVNVLSHECKSKFELEIDEKRKYVLSRYCLTYDEFKSTSKNLSEKIVQDIIDGFRDIKYEFRADFLVVGIDTNPHICLVDEFGNIRVYDHIGFAAIGSGEFLAFPEITRLAYSPDVNDTRAIVTVYNAKKAAERIQGVGEKTDLWLLRKDKNNKITLAIANDLLLKRLDYNIKKLRENETKLNENTMEELKKFNINDIFKIVDFSKINF